jgi:hypothetical protein
MQNSNASASANANSCSYPNVFPSPKPNGCSVLPYDGLVHGPMTGDIYSNWANKNNLGTEQKYKYWQTCDVPKQDDLWGPCKNRGGVVYNSSDHPTCNSRMNKDLVTPESMAKATDKGYAKINNGAYKSILGQDISVDGNTAGTNVRDYYVYGAYTASGGFVKDGDSKPTKCDIQDYKGYMNQPKSNYIPYGGPQKQCGKGYRFANGQRDEKLPPSGSGVSCEGLYRNFEDHNEQYLKEHYGQFNTNNPLPKQDELNHYKTNFMLLNDPMEGTNQYYSFGGSVNPFTMDPRMRTNNSHIPQYNK